MCNRGPSEALHHRKTPGQRGYDGRVGLYAGFCASRRLAARSRATAIHLRPPLPMASSGLPAGSGGPPSNACAAAQRTGRPSDLAPGGVYRAAPVTRGAGALLPHRFTLTGADSRRRRRSVFCGTVPRVTPGGRYPPPCPVEPGRSSAAPVAGHRRDRPAGSSAVSASVRRGSRRGSRRRSRAPFVAGAPSRSWCAQCSVVRRVADTSRPRSPRGHWRGHRRAADCDQRRSQRPPYPHELPAPTHLGGIPPHQPSGGAWQVSFRRRTTAGPSAYQSISLIETRSRCIR